MNAKPKVSTAAKAPTNAGIEAGTWATSSPLHEVLKVNREMARNSLDLLAVPVSPVL
jgi:hypothetical protein